MQSMDYFKLRLPVSIIVKGGQSNVIADLICIVELPNCKYKVIYLSIFIYIYTLFC